MSSLADNNIAVPEETNPKSFTTKHPKLLLTSLMFCNYWMGTSYVLPIPFFPEELKERGAPRYTYEGLFALYQIIIIVVSPFVGKTPFNPNALTYGAVFLCGAAALLMSLLGLLTANIPFIVLAFLARTLDGIGSAFYSASVYSILVMVFPENKAIIISSMESLNGLGMITGPAFSGYMYSFGGFSLPFLILSLNLLFAAILAKYLLPKDGNITQEKCIDLKQLVCHHSYIINLLICFSAYFVIGYNSDTLKVHLVQFNLSEHMLGIILVALGGMYIVSVPVWGRLCDTMKNLKLLIGIAVLFTFVGFIFIGPLPFLPIKSALWLVITSEILLGTGMGGQLICGFFDGIRGTIERGYQDALSSYTAVFGTILSATALGSLVGPFLGHVLTNLQGYIIATAYATGVEMIMMLLIWSYIVWKKFCYRDDEELICLLQPSGKNTKNNI